MPASSDTTTVRVANTVSPCGMVSPKLPNSAVRPFARATPSASPTSDAARPIAPASTITDRSTWRREAPRVRRVASSRERWATVIDSVLKMTKAPTNSATPPKASRVPRMKVMPSDTTSLSLAACSSPVASSTPGGRTASMRPPSSSVEVPGAAAT